MRVISFIEEPKVIDRIIRHLELTFEAECPPPPHHVQQDLLMAAEESGEYFWGPLGLDYLVFSLAGLKERGELRGLHFVDLRIKSG